MSYRRSGQTTTHKAQRTVSEKRTREYLAELTADRERYIERLDSALEENNCDDILKYSSWLEGTNKSIGVHESNLREFEAKRNSVKRTAEKRIAALTKLMNSCTREVDKAGYQQLITNEMKAVAVAK